MAGFFGFFDYTKPGPGIDKDAPPKARFIVFFEVLGRKFWNLVKMNILYNLFNLPAIIAAFYATHSIFRVQMIEDIWGELMVRLFMSAFLICIPVIAIGPAQAGYTYILRNYSREEHAFLWWDFKETALKNFKESTIICVLDFFFVLLFGYAINFWVRAEMDSVIPVIASTFLIMAFIVFLMMHLYIYPMLITFKLTVRQIYRNALIFALAKFLPNLGILLLCFLILVATFIYPVIGIILYIFFTVSFIGLITNFYSYPKLKKYIMDRLPDQENPDDEDTDVITGISETESSEDEETGETDGSDEEGLIEENEISYDGEDTAETGRDGEEGSQL
jgi:uncharacterized membrane protein YesL